MKNGNWLKILVGAFLPFSQSNSQSISPNIKEEFTLKDVVLTKENHQDIGLDFNKIRNNFHASHPQSGWGDIFF